MNNKHKLIIVVIVVLLASICFSTTIFGDEAFKIFKQAGSKVKSVNIEDDYIATINGKPIMVKEFKKHISLEETIKKVSFSPEESYEELKEEIYNELMLQEAEKKGMSVSQTEVEDAVQKAKEYINMNENIDEKNTIDAFIDGVCTTEEEYWDCVQKVYYKILTRGKLQNHLKQQFKSQHDYETQEEFENAFSNYIQNYKQDLFNNAEIKYNDKYVKDKKIVLE